jgi:hypothetical protein
MQIFDLKTWIIDLFVFNNIVFFRTSVLFNKTIKKNMEKQFNKIKEKKNYLRLHKKIASWDHKRKLKANL